jgi:hypothetical protein
MKIPQPAPGPAARCPLDTRYATVREASLALAAPLSAEDCQVQSMPDASPTKWHLAHVTWFFETFILERFEPGFRPFDPAFRVLFNSYYHGIGERHPRPERGLVTRPDLAQVRRYRANVDERMHALLAARGDDGELAALVELGLQHEQQHQELILTDIKHALSKNPLAPAYARRWPIAQVRPQPLAWVDHEGGLVELGHDARLDGEFCFDNETPRHQRVRGAVSAGVAAVDVRRLPRVHRGRRLPSSRALAVDGLGLGAGGRAQGAALLARRRRALADLHAAGPGRRRSPHAGLSSELLRGGRVRALVGRAVADRARMGDRRALARRPGRRQLRRPRRVSSAAAARSARRRAGADVRRRLGVDAVGVPRLSRLPAAAGRGRRIQRKFMCNQFVLRGGSCATPRGHVRASYRNFFPPDAQWQFSGVRLARDAG